MLIGLSSTNKIVGLSEDIVGTASLSVLLNSRKLPGLGLWTSGEDISIDPDDPMFSEDGVDGMSCVSEGSNPPKMEIRHLASFLGPIL